MAAARGIFSLIRKHELIGVAEVLVLWQDLPTADSGTV